MQPSEKFPRKTERPSGRGPLTGFSVSFVNLITAPVRHRRDGVWAGWGPGGTVSGIRRKASCPAGAEGQGSLPGGPEPAADQRAGNRLGADTFLTVIQQETIPLVAVTAATCQPLGGTADRSLYPFLPPPGLIFTGQTVSGFAEGLNSFDIILQAHLRFYPTLWSYIVK